jgi:hypothetical protein
MSLRIFSIGGGEDTTSTIMSFPMLLMRFPILAARLSDAPGSSSLKRNFICSKSIISFNVRPGSVLCVCLRPVVKSTPTAVGVPLSVRLELIEAGVMGRELARFHWHVGSGVHGNAIDALEPKLRG